MSLIPGKKNFKLKQGSTWDPVVQWKPGGIPANLTGWIARMQLRTGVAEEPEIEVTCTIPNPTDGKIFLKLEATQTDLIEPGNYLYDLELVLPSALPEPEVRCILEGSVAVSANITINA